MVVTAYSNFTTASPARPWGGAGIKRGDTPAREGPNGHHRFGHATSRQGCFQSATTQTSDSFSVATYYLRLLTDFCADQNLPVAGLLADELLDPAILDDSGARVGIETFVRLSDAVAGLLRIEHLGLQLGQHMQPRYLGPYGFTLLSCHDAAERRADLMRYSALAIDAGHNLIEEHGDQLILTWQSRLPQRHPSNRLIAELILASYLSMARRLTGRADLVPLWVALPWEQPRDAAPYSDVFVCPLRFGAERPAMGLDLRAAPASLQGNPEVHASMVALCERLLKKLPETEQSDWLSTCLREMASALDGGVPTLAQVARALDLTPSAFRLRLARSSLSFQELLDSLRRDLAFAYLHDPLVSLLEISQALGFSEQSAFQRAFRRWTGTTPGEHRRQQSRT